MMLHWPLDQRQKAGHPGVATMHKPHITWVCEEASCGVKLTNETITVICILISSCFHAYQVTDFVSNWKFLLVRAVFR